MLEDKSQNNKLQLLGKLNTSFVHEIRNPLFALKLNLDYLKLQDDIPDDIKDSVKACTEAVERIQFLIDSILDFSRKPKIKTEQCLLNDVTLQAAGLVDKYASKKNCSLVKELDDSIQYVKIDKNKLLQVLLNLMTNAIEASNENKDINIRTYKKQNHIYWEIEDKGLGIGDEEKKYIFQEFFTSKNNGTGLGLNICKEILNEFRADINFESEINKGSRFFIKFNS